ncbi:MAG: NfeD family protein [Cyanobacteria bacterium P01_C01_bin.70]
MDFSDLLSLTLGPTPWLVGSCLLLCLSWLVPNPVTAAFGLAGLVTALVAISIPQLPNQLLIWGLLSAAFTLIMRGLLPKESQELAAARHARVCEAIVPGQVGHVHYEGAIWQARCQISDVAIAPPAQVTVVERQGNTLVVLPIPPYRSTSG